VFGEAIDLVEIPMCMLQTDFLYFEVRLDNPFLPAGLRNARDVEAIWRDQFEYLRDGGDEGVYVLSLHPESAGYGSRVAMIERFLTYCASRSGTRFVTCAQVAEEFRRSHRPVEAAGR
jgi:hypothetical protein